MVDLGGRARRVHADGHRADALDAEVGEQPLGPVVAQHGDASARLDPELAQAEPDGGGARRIVLPRVLAPAAVPLLAEGDRRRPPAHLSQQEGRE